MGLNKHLCFVFKLSNYSASTKYIYVDPYEPVKMPVGAEFVVKILVPTENGRKLEEHLFLSNEGVCLDIFGLISMSVYQDHSLIIKFDFP